MTLKTERRGPVDAMSDTSISDEKAGGPRAARRLGVVVVDPFPVVRAGLASTIGSSPGLEVLAEASSADEAVAVVGGIRRTRVVVLVAMGLAGDRDSYWLIRALREHYPETRDPRSGLERRPARRLAGAVRRRRRVRRQERRARRVPGRDPERRGGRDGDRRPGGGIGREDRGGDRAPTERRAPADEARAGGARRRGGGAHRAGRSRSGWASGSGRSRPTSRGSTASWASGTASRPSAWPLARVWSR